MTQNRNIYYTIMTIYGARYQKEIKNKLKEQMKKYKTLRDLKLSPLSLQNTINNSEVIFKEGRLTSAIKEGSIYCR